MFYWFASCIPSHSMFYAPQRQKTLCTVMQLKYIFSSWTLLHFLVPLRNSAEIFGFTVYSSNSQAHTPNSGPKRIPLKKSNMRLSRQHARYVSRMAGSMNWSSWSSSPASSFSGWLSWLYCCQLEQQTQVPGFPHTTKGAFSSFSCLSSC